MKKLAVLFIFVFQTFFCQSSLAQEERAIQISPEAALALEQSLANRPGVKIERILLTDNIKKREDCHRILDPEKKIKCLKNAEVSQENTSGEGDILDVVQTMGQHANGRDAALIVFAVIGIVVLVIWIPYAIRFLYKFLKGDEVSGWTTLSTSYVNLKSTLQPSYSLRRDGELFGVNMLMAMGDEGGHMGLVIEGGQYSLSDVNTLTGVETKSKDKYLMAGPSLLYGFKEFNGSLDIIGGKGFGNNTGLMSKVALGLNFSFFKIYLGLQFGALYSQLKDLGGVTQDIDCFQLFMGTKLGITF